MSNPNLAREGTSEESDVTVEKPTTQASTDAVPAALQAVFDLNTIPDVTDRHIVEQAMLYAQNPTELSELSRHRSDVSTVCTGYEINEKKVPPAIDNLHRDLIEAECRTHIQMAEAELASSAPDLGKAEVHVLRALDNATVLAKPKGYNRPAMLADVQTMQQRLAALKQ